MAGFMANARQLLNQTDFEGAEALTLHTKSGIVVMQQLDSRSDPPLSAMIACPPRSNWYFFKSRLENLLYTAKGPAAK